MARQDQPVKAVAQSPLSGDSCDHNTSLYEAGKLVDSKFPVRQIS